jgi:transcriptional regulator with XRE-family HTH domain
MDPVADRIIQLIEQLQLTSTEFADKCNIKRPVLSHILSGRNNPSLMVIQHILESFTNVNSTWLMLGSGSMFTNVNLAPGLFSEQKLPPSSFAPPSQPKEVLEPQFESKHNIPETPPQELQPRGEKEAQKLPDSSSPAPVTQSKKIRQIVMFYEDGTFESFHQIPIAPSRP